MGFDVAIYNAGCRDGKKVVDSIKAAYLYADKVRVYDFFPMLDSIQEQLLKLRTDATDSAHTVLFLHQRAESVQSL